MQLTVYGTPAPQGSKKYVGNGIMIESSAKVTPWREAIKGAALQSRREPLRGAVSLTVTFTVKKPKSAPKRRVTYPSVKPDLDKYIRSTMDGLTDAGVWVDDGQVIYITAAKCYPNEGIDALHIPGAVITVEPIEEAVIAPVSVIPGLNERLF